MSIQLKLDKQVSVSEGQAPVYTLQLAVSEATGITPNIFVVRYIPASKYTGPESYTFWNVAYIDELLSIPDTPTNKRKACDIRRSCIIYKCNTVDSLNDFVTTVTTGIQRLIKSLSDCPEVAKSTITVTGDTAVELPCEENQTGTINPPLEDSSTATVSLSFAG